MIKHYSATRLAFLIVFMITGLYARAQVIINEYSAANFDLTADNYGDHEDWIELYNAGLSEVNLSGYYLSDRLTNPTKWQFPNGVNIAPGGHLLIWASNRDEYIANNLHTNFKLTQTRENEAVVFAGPDGVIIDSDSINLPNKKHHSWGRKIDGDNEWGVMTNPTPGFENFNVKQPYASTPQIAPVAGFYTGSVEITIDSPDENVSIRYTTNGSVPNGSSTLYSGPFSINNTAVVKAIAISSDPDIPSSHMDYHTYFINETHTVPVVSISGNQINSLMSGTQNEPEGSFEYFNEAGNRVADATGEFNKHGNDSWEYPQRGIDYITRDQFGDDWAIKTQLFPEISERDRFQRIILKAAANDNYPFEDGGCHIRDAYIHTLSQLAGLELDERTYEPCVLYVNGNYWGVYEIREKVDDHDYTEFYYDQSREWIDFIKTWGVTWEEYGSWDDWYALRNFINTNDMSNAANYAYVEEQLDVLSMIDYIILHAHNVSSDWLNWNTAWWRGRKPTGGARKWRYILWDEDATFGHYINYSDIPTQSPNADPCDPEEIPSFTDFEGHIELFSDLFENDDFKSLYINRYADLNNTFFRCDYMIPLLDQMLDRIAPEMPRQISRWGGSMQVWQANIVDLKNFIEQRCTIIEDAIVDCYEDEGITGPYDILVDVEPVGAGKVQLNTAVGQSYPWTTTYYGGVNIDLNGLPELDWEFDHWEVANNSFAPDEFAQAISMSVEMNDTIVAFFVPDICVGALVEPEIEGENSICPGETVVLTVPTGFETYNWSDNSNLQSLQVNEPGTYRVTVTDEDGCPGIDEFLVSLNEPPNLEIEGLLSFCIGGSTTLDAGAGFLGYNWSDETSQQTLVVNEPGIYSVTITDNNGCTSSDFVDVQEGNFLVMEISGEVQFCEGTTTELDAGPGFNSYLWSDNSTSQTLVTNEGGIYRVTVSDGSGCLGMDEVFVEVVEQIITEEDRTICYGDSFQGTTYTSDAVITNSFPGSSLCDSLHQINLEVLPEINITFNVEDECTLGGSTVIANPVGGSGNYTYEWNNNETGPILTELSNGIYWVEVTDDFGCANTASVEVMSVPGVSFEYEVQHIVCNGDNNGYIGLQINSGTPPYDIQWSNGASGQQLNNLSEGQYTVIVSDANACNFVTTISIYEPDPLEVEAVFTPADNGNNGTATALVTGGTTPYTYDWSTGDESVTIEDLPVGEYSLTITDASGCTTETSVEVLMVGTRELSSLATFVVYPNPSNGRFLLQLEFDVPQDDTELFIYNLLGQEIHFENFGNVIALQEDIDLNEFPSGTYYLQVKTQNGAMAQKLVISK